MMDGEARRTTDRATAPAVLRCHEPRGARTKRQSVIVVKSRYGRVIARWPASALGG
jgi:hypothetical protein